MRVTIASQISLLLDKACALLRPYMHFTYKTYIFSRPGSRWRTKNLTYKISKYPTGLNKQEVDKEIAKAFDVWSGETDLTFTRKSGHENVRQLSHRNI